MPRQCVLLCLKPIRKRLMRCQLLGQLEHVLGRPFSYVVLPTSGHGHGRCMLIASPTAAAGWVVLHLSARIERERRARRARQRRGF
jgi:hypothetical protein